MSLTDFHILFIILSIALSLFVGVWAVRAGQFFWGIIAFLAAGALIIYGINFLKKIKSNANASQK